MDKLRFGIGNIIADSTVSATSEQTAMPVTNIQDNTISFFKSILGTCTVTITLPSSQLVSFVSLHNTTFSALTITGKLSGGTVFQQTGITTNDLSGLEVMSFVMDSSYLGTVDTIELAFTGAIAPEIGYVFVGTSVDFAIRTMQAFDEVTDSPVATNGNTISTNLGYSFRSYDVGVGHESFSALRSKIRSIFQDESYSEPRGIEISGDCIPTDCLLGVLDSGRFGYSIDVNKDSLGEYKAIITVGLREVFGGNS